MMTIRSKLIMAMVLSVVSIGSIVTCWWVALDAIKVNGAIYKDIIQAKDLVADILPPPEYIIEPYLLATKALDASPATVAGLKDRIEALKQEYMTRHQVWLNASLPPDVARDLLSASYDPALRFFRTCDTAFFPALARQDTDAARAAFKEMTDAYETHRAAIDKVVIGANAIAERTEARAAEQEEFFKVLAVTLSAGLTAVLVILLLMIARTITAPVRAIARTMDRLSAGDLTVAVEGGGRRDEVGEIARAVGVFKAAMIEGERLKGAQAREHAEAEKAKIEALRVMAETVEHESRQAVDAIAEMTRAMADNADGMAHSAAAVGDNSQGVSSAAAQALANAETVAAAAHQLSGAIAEISRQVSTATEVTGSAVMASEGAQRTITSLSEAVARIGSVATLINSIAA
ncbi:HAMP domain-containing protein, partial [Pararhodospirillum oryzae]|uniref:HAMP domain-containing protein n=1 Tax=Pararhodospirillum oryzae TaxID=478448 RepID=UPI0014795A0A